VTIGGRQIVVNHTAVTSGSGQVSLGGGIVLRDAPADAVPQDATYANRYETTAPTPEPGQPDLRTTEGADTLVATVSNDWLRLAGGDDSANGNAGDDRIEGEDGNDGLGGGAGNDILIGGAGDNDILLAGTGDDFLYAGSQTTRAQALVAANEPQPTAARGEWLGGEAGEDTLIGAGGDDVLMGGTQNDWLIGSSGNDILFGDRTEARVERTWSVTRQTSTGPGGATLYRPEFTGVTSVADDPANAGDDRLHGGSGDDPRRLAFAARRRGSESQDSPFIVRRRGRGHFCSAASSSATHDSGAR